MISIVSRLDRPFVFIYIYRRQLGLEKTMQTHPNTFIQAAGYGSILAVMLLLITGCPTDRQSPGVSGQRPAPLLGPVAINVHDSSAVVCKSAGDEFDGIIAACEVLDRFGDSIKTMGLMRFEAYEYAPSEPENKGPRIGFWPDVRIDSLEGIQQHWDSIWGMYRFNLTWQVQVRPQQRYILEATLTTPNGQQFSANHILQVSS